MHWIIVHNIHIEYFRYHNKILKRLRNDLLALDKLLGGSSPPHRLIRGRGMTEIIYGFGDASGLGFGSSWENLHGNRGVEYRVGVWS